MDSVREYSCDADQGKPQDKPLRENNMITKGTNRSISTNKVVSRRKMPLLDANWGFDDLADYGFLSRVLPTDPMKVTAGK